MSDAIRWSAAAVSSLAWLGLTGWTAWRHRRARPAALGPEGVLVVYASQTGTAATLARATADALLASGRQAAVRNIAQVTPSLLADAGEALFVVATTGEGDAPDDAATFLREMRLRPIALGKLRYAVLALGDSHYRHFCAFGRALDHLLHEAGGMPVADRLEVDQGDTGALRHWQQNLRLFGASAALPDWEAPRYARWWLAERELLNAGSPGEPMYRLRLTPEGALPDWSAGDIAEVYPGPADAALAPTPRLPHRDYSLASIPGEGAIELVVRLFRDAEGRTGLGSGWLCQGIDPGDAVALRIRANPRFHAPAPSVPLVLIGAGTGISGLRAHLKARPAGTRNWLIFGERDPARDRPFDDALEAWALDGHIARLDRVFSRHAGEGARYVQHVVAVHADELRRWVDQGAAIYVCGSIAMGTDVDAALRAILGDTRVDALADKDRYRRDVY